MIAELLAGASKLIAGTTVRWHCDPFGVSPRIYFSNHTSHFDSVVIWSALPSAVRRRVRPVGGADYWERTAMRRDVAGRIFRAVLIQRSHGASSQTVARASVERMIAAIDAGDSLIMFPEGSRAADGDVGAFKSGLFHLMQLRPEVELVPVHLENLNRILPKGEVLPVPMLGRVVFGPPLIRVRDEDKPCFLARAREAVIHLQVSA